jgi:hypothetical protein
MKIIGGTMTQNMEVTVDVVMEYYERNKLGQIETLLSFWVEFDSGKKYPIIGSWDNKPLVQIPVELSTVKFSWNGFRINVRKLFPGLKLGQHTLQEYKYKGRAFFGYEHEGVIIRVVTE